MSAVHLLLGQCALACGDVDGTQVEINIVLDLVRFYSTSKNAHAARVMLARIELSRQSPASCLAHIQSDGSFPAPVAGRSNFEILRADLCLFI